MAYGAQTIELHEGDVVVAGRSSRCDIVLDDELASRQHCKIMLRGDRVFVEDTGSRNGVLINGLEVEGRHELHHGDQVTAGRSAMTLLRQAREPRLRTSSESLEASDPEDDLDAVTGTGNLVDLLDGSARKALHEDDLMVAERTTLNLFGLLRRAARGRYIQPEELAGAARLALDLAERTRDPMWLGHILELHVTAGRLVAAPVDTRLAEVARDLGPPERAVEQYVELADRKADQGAVARLCRQLVGPV